MSGSLNQQPNNRNNIRSNLEPTVSNSSNQNNDTNVEVEVNRVPAEASLLTIGSEIAQKYGAIGTLISFIIGAGVYITSLKSDLVNANKAITKNVSELVSTKEKAAELDKKVSINIKDIGYIQDDVSSLDDRNLENSKKIMDLKIEQVKLTVKSSNPK
jgi:hypothetical protein